MGHDNCYQYVDDRLAGWWAVYTFVVTPHSKQYYHCRAERMTQHWKTCILKQKYQLLILAVFLVVLTALLCKNNSNTILGTLWRNTLVSAGSGHHSDIIQHGYIIANGYSGQQGSGVRALVSLQCWASSFSLPVYIVEPYIAASSLASRLKSKDLTNVMKFSDYFDVDHFNNVSLEEGSPPLISVEHFIERAPRQTIVVRLHKINACRKKPHPEFQVLKESNGVGKCCSSVWLHNWQMSEAKFCVVKVVRIEGCMSLPSATREMYKTIFKGWDPSNVTVVFRFWAANWDKLQNPDSKAKMLCKDVNGQKLRHKFYPSPKLLNDAKYYTNTYLRGQTKVAVMIRSEQAIRGFQTGNRLKQLNLCINKVVDIARNLTSTTSSPNTSNIFLTLDVGKYGSNSVESVLRLSKYNLKNKSSDVITSVKNIVPTLYGRNWTFVEWEESFIKAADGIENPGYIASLQRTIASRADCLILMGGGDYQRLALHDYLELHPDTSQQCLQFVCFREGFQEQFSDIVQYDEEDEDPS